ncbi:hypothetical protein ACFL0W_04330 [Nanoarchaeota archaeon]
MTEYGTEEIGEQKETPIGAQMPGQPRHFDLITAYGADKTKLFETYMKQARMYLELGRTHCGGEITQASTQYSNIADIARQTPSINYASDGQEENDKGERPTGLYIFTTNSPASKYTPGLVGRLKAVRDKLPSTRKKAA